MRLKLEYVLPSLQVLLAIALLVWTDRWQQALMRIQDMPGTPPFFALLIAINAPFGVSPSVGVPPSARLVGVDNSRCGDWNAVVLGVTEYQILATKPPSLHVFMDTIETGGRRGSRWHRCNVGLRTVTRSCL